MLVSVEMQMDEIKGSWVEEVQKAFEPYAQFVEAIATRLEEIELQAILHPPAPLEVQVKIETAVLHPPSEKSIRAKPAKVLSPKRVLLVDDAEINRVLLSHYFKGLPVKLEFASTNELALAAEFASRCQDSNFDLIFCDEEFQNSEYPEVTRITVPVLDRSVPRDLLIEQLKSHLWKS